MLDIQDGGLPRKKAQKLRKRFIQIMFTFASDDVFKSFFRTDILKSYEVEENQKDCRSSNIKLFLYEM